GMVWGETGRGDGRMSAMVPPLQSPIDQLGCMKLRHWRGRYSQGMQFPALSIRRRLRSHIDLSCDLASDLLTPGFFLRRELLVGDTRAGEVYCFGGMGDDGGDRLPQVEGLRRRAPAHLAAQPFLQLFQCLIADDERI